LAEGASTLPRGDKPQPAALYQAQEEPARLLVAKDEISWMTHNVPPDRSVDVFLLLGCGARGLPHILLDSVAVLEALGVRFVAGAGQQFCCGNPYRPDRLDAADRLTANSIDRMTAWGASTIVHWCTACQLTFGAWSRNSEEVWSGGTVMPMQPRGAVQDGVENVHIHTFIERRLRELGDRVPWKNTPHRRVLVEGHPELTEVHDVAMTTGAKMLSLVPGVEVLGYVKAPEAFGRPGSNCSNALADLTFHDVQRIRSEVAVQARARGADTISCQHHNCHRTWSRFASEGLRVEQCVSIVAEALGVRSPDRYQEFAQLGETDRVVDRTEPIWRTWGIDRAEATDLARKTFDPKYAAKPSCPCGGDVSKCTEEPLVQIGSIVRS
jgi:Fe-S oxidoreductase